MKSDWQSYRQWAHYFVREIKHPHGRLLIALFCLLASVGLAFRVLQVWLRLPSQDPAALVFLAVPLLGSLFLLRVIYLVLFAPVARQRLGILPIRLLTGLGAVIILTGLWGLVSGTWEALFLVGLGLACVSLARERAQRKREQLW